VNSSAGVGSGSVWPTFSSGQHPTLHGLFSEWAWQPDTMTVRRFSARHVVPFWKTLVDEGRRIGILDLPFMPTVGLTDGFEISDWGPHDIVEGRRRITPAGVLGLVTAIEPHPLSLDRLDVSGPDDYQRLERLG